MPRKIQIEKKVVFRCDECKKEETLPIGAKRTGWLSVSVVATDGLRLFEKMAKTKRYESFNIPNKEEKVYCSRDCIFRSLTKSIDLFIAEISPSTLEGLKRKIID